MLTFDEEKHEYRLDGERIPSVTELLKPLTAEGYERIAPDTLRIAAERGTEVHEACEAMDYGEDPEDVSEDVYGYLDAYTQFLTDHEVEWCGVEDKGSCTTFGYPFAGTVDRWGKVDGEPTVLDIKTIASPSIEQKCSVALQTMAYEWIIREKYNIPYAFRRRALYLKKNGKYNLADLDDFAANEQYNRITTLQKLCEIYRAGEEVRMDVERIKDKHRRKKKNEQGL